MVRFPSLAVGREVSLTAGDARLVVAPECGARLLRFDVGDVPVLRPAPQDAIRARPYDFAGFPLVPYSGPIFGGGFAFDSSFHGLARNVAMEADATHGDGWIRSWTVSAEMESRLDLTLDYVPVDGGFPFAWQAGLTYELGPDALRIAMALTNRDIRPMPAGMGFHPYFARSEGAVLTFRHGRVWPPDSPEAVGVGAAKPPVGLDFNAGIPLDGLVADRCFEDWDGLATLRVAGREVRLTASPVFGKLQLYVPWYDPYVCIEPVTNANDGFNRAARGINGHGMVVLRPGETLSGTMEIAVRAAGDANA